MNVCSNLLRLLFVYEMPNSLNDHNLVKQRDVLLEPAFVYVVLYAGSIVREVQISDDELSWHFHACPCPWC